DEHYLYVGSIDGVVKRFNVNSYSDVIWYDITESNTDYSPNNKVKSIIVSTEKQSLFVSLDNGSFFCFNLNSGKLISDYKLDSYVVLCVEAWDSLIVARSDRNITFLSLMPKFTHIRTIGVRGRYQTILAIHPINKGEEKQLLMLGKGWKPIVNFERTKMEFTKGVVTAAKLFESKIVIALLHFNFTRILCYDFNRWKQLWTTLIGYEKVFALDFNETGVYFGCRNGCVHRIAFDLNNLFRCENNSCNCGQTFAMITDLNNSQFH
ncbi:hypothetical protein B4U80_14304, partial [Leptotrombidium deliense]